MNARETKIWCSFTNKGTLIAVWWKGHVTPFTRWKEACRNLGAVSFDYYFIYGKIK